MQLQHLLTAITLLVAVQAQQIDSQEPSDVQEIPELQDAPDVLNATLAPGLLRRIGANDGSSPANARDLQLDCTGISFNCDANAYAMLCAGAPRTLRRNSANKSKHYRRSGAKCQPFRNAGKYGVHIPFPDFVSPEEFPYESCDVENEAARRVVLFPVRQSDQNSQGGRLNADYTRWHVGANDWFHITRFNNCNGPYCIGFNNNDARVCKQKLKPGELDWNSYAIVKTSQPHKAITFGGIGFPKVKRDGEVEEADVPLKRPDGEDPWYVEEEWEDDGLATRDAVCTDD